ncbi:GNAT family N-acetyltransferase [Zhengella mangrovi]|uniref:GNAT family N-acetyltransferase n=1 Tax=Zhengella mangrovi TaxID=1982044 RepID=A0A2G1QUD1_9HYPH|nr:GNAT family N-acetyltransferase [Zhengella mangrovi]PHP69101.1 GNAT family N-acetyltransferase [Zhengella mangrovi]
MNDIVIRQATADDRDDLEALIGACYSAVYPGWYSDDILTDAMPAMLRIDPALLASGHYFTASIGGRLAGCGGWSKTAPGTGRPEDATGHIRHFATDPDLMRAGVGSAILTTCINEAKRDGVGRLMCFSSRPAEKFYARHGFRRLEEVSVMLGDEIAFPAVMMERTA